MPKDDVVDIHVRLPRELHKKIEKSAKADRRPINSEIIVRLEETFQGEQK